MELCCTNEIELRSGAYRARIAPEAGGRVVSLSWCGARDSVDLLVPWDGSPFPEHAWPKAGAFPMLPFANRLPAHGFEFRGCIVRPESAPSGLVQHGVAHRRAWRVMDVSAERVRMRLDEDASGAWPWSWSAEMDVSLGGAGMTVLLRVRNLSREAMPLGMGWHPYHPAGPGTCANDLRFDAAARYDLDHAAQASTLAAEPRFTMRPGETASFSGWSGRAQLHVAGGSIMVACEGARDAVLHKPASGDYLCIEPVTVLPGHLGDDAASLPPGQVQQLTWICGYAQTV
jgi:aldose 1-epimerase